MKKHNLMDCRPAFGMAALFYILAGVLLLCACARPGFNGTSVSMPGDKPGSQAGIAQTPSQSGENGATPRKEGGFSIPDDSEVWPPAPGIGSENSLPQSEPGENVDFKNPNSLLVLVSRDHALPPDYIPLDLTTAEVPFSPYAVPERKNLRKEAALALARLFEGGQNAGLTLYSVSGYRSYGSQEAIYNAKLQADGPEETERYIARPGHSEHQTGLAMDVTNQTGLGKELSPAFGQSPEGIWLAENAFRFGFIIRYPQGKEDITGYAHEPWHLRYVGLDAALEITKAGQTLEEYLGCV